jgi:hypothetical protein
LGCQPAPNVACDHKGNPASVNPVAIEYFDRLNDAEDHLRSLGFWRSNDRDWTNGEVDLGIVYFASGFRTEITKAQR